MSPWIRIPLGFLVMLVGMHMVFKTRLYLSWFGRIPFAEKKFGQGGTETFYKLLGVLISFIGIFIVTNIISDILESFAGVFV
jgi:hypothetical protein